MSVFIENPLFSWKMTRTIPSILFMITILLTAGIAASVDVIEDASALKSKGTKTQKYGSATKNLVCGAQLCSEMEETPQPKKEVEPVPAPKTEPKAEPKPKTEPAPTPAPKTERQTQLKSTQQQNEWKTSSGTITSSQDPGVGHETHQLAIILPPTSNVYKGILSYDASEPIQLIALHGPLGKDDAQGQAIWTPDGKTKFAMTFVDPQTSMGSWVLLVMHLPFTHFTQTNLQ
jgi:hypothetical protein